MKVALDHSALVNEGAAGMDGERDRQRPGNEPRGFLPRVAGAPPAWRRVRAWLLGDRAHIGQEGLLAERTLKIAPRRARREEPPADAAAPDRTGDESA
jgi:hypothetical protein